jgi:integration host factor subunit alpha
MRDALEGGEIVKLAGFGSFQLRDKRLRPGRNPKTGIATLIASRRVVTFRSGPTLKARLEANREQRHHE